jgi:hypothetical protein
MQSRVWEQYASLTRQARPADPNLPELMKGGGRYYRNISLLERRPMLHYAQQRDRAGDLRQAKCGGIGFYSSPRRRKRAAAEEPARVLAIRSIGRRRYKLYVASMVECSSLPRLRKVFHA